MGEIKRIAITGANGTLGAELVRYLRTVGAEVLIVPSDFYRPSLNDFKFNALIKEAHIDVFIHCAANTRVDECENHPDKAYKDNHLLTKGLCEQVSDLGLHFVYISSTGVYCPDHFKPSSELETAQPVSHHHRSKLLGEEEVQRANFPHTILRVGWIFGARALGSKDFVRDRYNDIIKLAPGDVYYCNDQQVGNPTSVGFVSSVVWEVILKRILGTYNCVNQGVATRLEYVKKIAEFSGLNVQVKGKPASSFSRAAPVTLNESASWGKVEEILTVPHWHEDLNRYIGYLKTSV
jgi:dTDP-4-dehydrorhamnose reductase